MGYRYELLFVWSSCIIPILRLLKRYRCAENNGESTISSPISIWDGIIVHFSVHDASSCFFSVIQLVSFCYRWIMWIEYAGRRVLFNPVSKGVLLCQQRYVSDAMPTETERERMDYDVVIVGVMCISFSFTCIGRMRWTFYGNPFEGQCSKARKGHFGMCSRKRILHWIAYS